MSKSINSCQLSGELDCDAQLRATPTGTSVCNCIIAVVDEFPQREGPPKFFTNRFAIVGYSRAAEALKDGRKGDRVIVSGSLGTESWQGQDGKKNFKTIVKVDKIIFLDADQGHPSQPQTQAPAQPAPGVRQPTAREMAQKKADFDDDQPPF